MLMQLSDQGRSQEQKQDQYITIYVIDVEMLNLKYSVYLQDVHMGM